MINLSYGVVSVKYFTKKRTCYFFLLSDKMDGFDAFNDAPPATTEVDPAAEFLAQEQVSEFNFMGG